MPMPTGAMAPGATAPRPMAGAPAPRAAPPPSTRSMFNPQDVAAKAKMGDVDLNMSLEEFFKRNYGLSMQSTLGEFIEKTRGQLQNATALGKTGAAAQMQRTPQGAPSPAPMPTQAPRGAPRPQQADLGSLLGRL
jgi:hypothetical protein